MKKFLLSLLVLGTITGIIPAILMVLISKYTVLAVITGIFAIILLTKELCF